MQTAAIREKYSRALNGLAHNIDTVFGYDEPVLLECATAYRGIWLECGPLEGLLYGKFEPDIAKANHEVFFHHQREDGYLPCWVRGDRLGTAQIQMVVPIAATALETAELTEDEGFLARAYEACERWDNWLGEHRDTRGTGLCEMFCGWDTGHDNSLRIAGLPNECPNEDARVCSRVGKLPYLAPDLSASVYGGRRALAEMAHRLGKDQDADMWLESAEELRAAIIRHCYDPEDECFYDVDRDGHFVKLRGDALTRVLGEHVVEQDMFERIYERYIRNPQEFGTPFPLPSVSIGDPQFVHEFRTNTWGGPSQALTALRAPRWFEHYGKFDDLEVLMRRWVEAIVAAPAFMQQMNPWTGEFSFAEGYSPCMCVFIDFVDRLGALDG